MANHDWHGGHHRHDWRFFSMKWDRCLACNRFRPHQKGRYVKAAPERDPASVYLHKP